MAVSKCPCLNFSATMSCLDAKISLVPRHKLIVPSTLLAPATHIRTDKATEIHTLRPLTSELFFFFSKQLSNLKRFIPIILLCPQCSLSKMRNPKRKCFVYFSTFSYIHSFPCENRTGSQLLKSKQTICLILVNLQAIAGGKKCCFRR